MRLLRTACLVVLVPALVTQAAETSPVERTRELYESYVDSGKPLNIRKMPLRSRWFSSRIVALLEKDEACAQGEIGLLSFDPVIWGQDFELSDVTTTASAPRDGKVRVTVRFKNFGELKTMHLDWVETESGWRIDDIDPGAGESLSEVLDEPCP